MTQEIRRGEKCPHCGVRHLRNIAVDALAVQDSKIALVKRGNEPQKGFWALPGGLLDWDEDAGAAVLRELTEETGLIGELGGFVGVYSDPGRDKFQRVTIVYEVRVSGGELVAGGDALDARWFSLSKLPELAADHATIIGDYLAKRGG